MFASITNWDGDLINQFNRLQNDLEQIWGSPSGPANIRAVARGSYPSINIGTTSAGVEIYIFAAGLDPKQVDLSVQRNLVTIAGNIPSNRPENTSTYLKERHAGEFRRVLTLPEDIDPDSASAKYDNGVLRVSFTRKEEARPRRIAVNA
ncbi:MAG: Hsp20/alpha crystallin family protein [Halioglobus sp.]